MPANIQQKGSIKKALQNLFPSTRPKLTLLRPSERGPDFVADVRSEAGHLRLLIEFLPEYAGGRLRDVAALLRQRSAEPDSLWVLATEYLSPAQQERLRSAGVSFFDLAGNAWLRERGLLIDRRGFPNPKAMIRLPRGAFSDKASLVVRSLLDSPHGRGIRDLAEELELSPGYVSKVVRQLNSGGYVARRRGGISLRHADELLEDWVHAYRGRAPAFVTGYFVLAPDAKSLLGELVRAHDAGDDRYVLTGQAGAYLVAPYADFDQVDVYVRQEKDAESFAAQLNARQVDRGANVRIMIPYYRVSAFYGIQRAQGLAVVSDLQLYLDLYDFPVRGREQAEHLYARRLEPKLRVLEEDRS